MKKLILLLSVLVYVGSVCAEEDKEALKKACEKGDESACNSLRVIEDSSKAKKHFKFSEFEEDKVRFIAFSVSIELSSEQQDIRKQVLSSISSPCCNKPTAYNCCGCDVAQSILGLSNYLITNNYNSETVRGTLKLWVDRIGASNASCEHARVDGSFEQEEPVSCEVSTLEDVVGACVVPDM